MPAPVGELIGRGAGPLAAGLMAVLAAAILSAYPPIRLAAADAPSWLPFTLAAAAAGGTAIAGVAWVAVAVRAASARSFAQAAGVASLAAGVVIVAAGTLDDVASLPDPGFGLAAAAGGTCLALATVLPNRSTDGRQRRVAGLVVLFVVVELAAAAALLLADQVAEMAGWLLAGAAIAAAVRLMGGPGPQWGTAVVAGGLLALAIARPGTGDVLPGLLALAAGGLLLAAQASPGRQARVAADLALIDDLPLQLREVSPGDGAPPDGEEPIAAQRLTRELRGTIEELMQTRRTVELQRGELSRAASIDPLTGVASRRTILERVSTEAAEAHRYTHPLAVMLIDVDDFTAINHDHGLAVGDAVLRELALRLRLRIRAADALGRHGPDSFLAILPHTDERGGAIFADAVRRRLSSRPILTGAGELRVGVSIGVAFMRPGMDISDEAVLAAADEALASARAAGGNRIAFDRRHGLVRLEEPRTGRPGA